MIRLARRCTWLFCLTCPLAWTQATPHDAVKRVADDPKFKAAMAALDKDHDRLVAEIIELTEIAAPPVKEDQRGAKYLEMLRAAGLTHASRRRGHWRRYALARSPAGDHSRDGRGRNPDEERHSLRR